MDAWRAVRRWVSGAEWSAKLLHAQAEPDDAPGLVLIQIDGLSEHELRRALDRGRLPQLRRILAREHYELQPLYSGLPSTTPAVQGELFFGARAAVPAFSFADRARGEVVEMLAAEEAQAVERKLAARDPGLLAGGSGYCNIYSGGATEAHFCAVSLGWGEMFRNVHPWSLLLAVLWNFSGLIRIAGKLLFELGVIAVDLVRGLVGDLDFKREWERVGSRLVVGIIMEELMSMSASVDIVRGLPVVQFNFLSYDECGHLRGPDSVLAHRALGRIDAAIGRVWRETQRAQSRHYAVWIHSDHGQERTTPYDAIAGRTFLEAVGLAFAYDTTKIRHQPAERVGSRAAYLRRRKPRPVEANRRTSAADEILVAAIGPVGHIYLPKGMTEGEVRTACAALAAEHKVPLVLRRRDDGTFDAWTAAGEGRWPEDAAKIVGANHPFAAAIAADVPALCNHPDAGDVVVFAWREGLEPISFVKELGAHGGFGPRETGAFAMLPLDAPVHPHEQAFLRPDDLRRGALRWLGRDESPARKRAVRLPTKPLRIVTYNVHSCVGLDGRLSPARIARVLAQCDADVVALQELDVMRSRTGRLDQAAEIARLLETEHRFFHPAISAADEQYGDAILSRLPMRLVRAAALPGTHLGSRLEPRGAIWVAVEWEGREVQIVNTHLGLLASERALQIETLLGDEWLEHPDCRGPVVFCGDLNLVPRSATFRRLSAKLRDAQTAVAGRRARNTWFSPLPLARIDHLFVRGGLEVVDVRVPRTGLTATASDHLPLVADLRWSAGDEGRSAPQAMTLLPDAVEKLVAADQQP
jgi:endonuclease/exonuclease/phosphatase family metal-dependent hydrolase